MICQYCMDLAGEKERRKSASYLRQANELRERAEQSEAQRDEAVKALREITDQKLLHSNGVIDYVNELSRVYALATAALERPEVKP